MFTGIVEHAGRVARIERQDAGARLVVEAGPLARDARIGDSVAVNGCCLTIVAAEGETLAFDAVAETLRRTNLGELRPGDCVNLERPLRIGGRLDGHLVQGHVDGTATLEAVTEEGSGRRLSFRAAPELLRYIAEKGSVAVDGISLTVAAVRPEGFEVVVIPHTWAVTNLSRRAVGSRANLEVDILAKYVERLLGSGAREPR